MSKDDERIVGLYRRHVNAWATARGRQRGDRPIEAGWLARFLGLLPPRPTMLDIGCGSGEPIGCYLVEHGCDLTGVDSAPEMIDLCETRLPEQAWRVADMRSLSLGLTFDGIIAWDSFFHLCPADQRRMFPIFRVHAVSPAALMFTSGPDHGVAMGTLEGEPLYHSSLDSAEYRVLLDQNDFNVVAHAVEDPSCGCRTIWLAQVR